MYVIYPQVAFNLSRLILKLVLGSRKPICITTYGTEHVQFFHLVRYWRIGMVDLPGHIDFSKRRFINLNEKRMEKKELMNCMIFHDNFFDDSLAIY